MRVVVIGGTGNISTGVVKALLQWGHEVTVFNRGLHRDILPKGVRYLRGDRKNREAFEGLMQAEKFHAAIDMICYEPEDAESDVRAFRGVKHFINTSTVATFGGPLAEVPTSETSPLRPVIPYGHKKVACDNIVWEARRRGDLPVTIFKPAHTWGQGVPVLRQFGWQDHRWVDRLRQGLPILIADGGVTVWSYCHSDDAGVAYAAALGRERCIGQDYILTSPKYRTWLEYTEGVAAGLGCKATLVNAPTDFLLKVLPENTPLLASEARWNRLYDLSTIRRDIPEFDPRITLEESIPACVAWMEEQGLYEDARSDDKEDRIIASLDRLYAEWGTAR